jgi:methanogenic corrinoid protein MtbC1
MNDTLSPHQAALAIGVSESSLKRWCDRGVLAMRKTAGGHRRIDIVAILQFLREQNQAPSCPELLGLTVPPRHEPITFGKAREILQQAFIQGDEQTVTMVGYSLFFAGHPLASMFDEVLAPALHTLGEKWQCGHVDIHQERRACYLTEGLLYSLAKAIPESLATAPLAIGATLDGDYYTVAVTMAGLIAREAGWRASLLGSNIPTASLMNAFTTYSPNMVWLSVNYISDAPSFIVRINQLADAVTSAGSTFAIGGRALTETIRRQIRYTFYGDNLTHLSSFIKCLKTVGSKVPNDT